MAGGYKLFGPTFKSTDALRVAYEGTLNGLHTIDVEGLAGEEELAGKFAKIGEKGVTLAGDGEAAVGIFREDLADMVNASEKATFYFRGGEYYVAMERTGLSSLEDIKPGDEVQVGENGKLVKKDSGVAVGVVTSVGSFKAGNMYEHAAAKDGNYIGFILYV